MKKTASLFLAVLLLFSLCACGKAEEFVIYENIPDYKSMLGGFLSDWYTPVNPEQTPLVHSDEAAPKTFSLSLNGQTIQGNYVGSFEKGTTRSRAYDNYEVEGKRITFQILRESGKLLTYNNEEEAQGAALSASERIALLNRMKEECEKHVSAGWKEHYEYEVDPDGTFMRYYPMVEGLKPIDQKRLGVWVNLNADGTVKSVDATQFPLVERYGKQELEQTVEALRSDRLVPAIEKHLEKMCSVNESTVFISFGREDPEKDYRDYEKGEYTKYEFGQEENEVWIVSSEGKLGKIVFLDVYRKLTPKNGQPLYDCRSECLVIFLA